MAAFRSYINYRLKSVNAHGLHSPFVFQFYNEVVRKAHEVNDRAIKDLCKKLERSREHLVVTDFGAGSRKGTNSSDRSVAEIAKQAAMRSKYGKLLNRLAEFYELKEVVELGTSLGIGSLYLGSPSCVEKLVTVEGDPGLAGLAARHFEQLGLKKAVVLNGQFEEQLDEVIRHVPQPDLVFVDGNHRLEPTLNYFEFFLRYAHDDCFLIFDDIYWSEEMTKAWETICASPDIHVSMDLFRFGIVCKKPGQAKEHFVLRY